MSDTRVELRVSFTVSSDTTEGRRAAERAIRMIEWLGKAHLRHDCDQFEVARGAVNGNGWEERWPSTREDRGDA